MSARPPISDFQFHWHPDLGEWACIPRSTDLGPAVGLGETKQLAYESALRSIAMNVSLSREYGL